STERSKRGGSRTAIPLTAIPKRPRDVKIHTCLRLSTKSVRILRPRSEPEGAILPRAAPRSRGGGERSEPEGAPRCVRSPAAAPPRCLHLARAPPSAGFAGNLPRCAGGGFAIRGARSVPPTALENRASNRARPWLAHQPRDLTSIIFRPTAY